MDIAHGGTLGIAHVETARGQQLAGVPYLCGRGALRLNGGKARTADGGLAEVEHGERFAAGNLLRLGDVETEHGSANVEAAFHFDLVALGEAAAHGKRNLHRGPLLQHQAAAQVEGLGLHQRVAGMEDGAFLHGDAPCQRALACQGGPALHGDGSRAVVCAVDHEGAAAHGGGAAIGVGAREAPHTATALLDADDATTVGSATVPVVDDAVELLVGVGHAHLPGALEVLCVLAASHQVGSAGTAQSAHLESAVGGPGAESSVAFQGDSVGGQVGAGAIEQQQRAFAVL